MENIIQDIGTLGLQFDKITYTSDYFPQVCTCVACRPVLYLLKALRLGLAVLACQVTAHRDGRHVGLSVQTLNPQPWTD